MKKNNRFVSFYHKAQDKSQYPSGEQTMGYGIIFSDYDSHKIIERINHTDLVPSLECLKSVAEGIISKLESRGINNLESFLQNYRFSRSSYGVEKLN